MTTLICALGWCLVIPIFLHAQGDALGVALLTNTPSWSDPFFSKVNQAVVDGIRKSKADNIFFYDWDPDTQSVSYAALNQKEEKPCHTMIYLYGEYHYPMNPPLHVQRGEKNVITGVSLALNPRAGYQMKIVDVATGSLLSIQHVEVHKETPKSIAISDHAKLFGGDPDVLKKNNAAKYNAIVAGLHEKYRNDIVRFYQQLVDDSFIYKAQTRRLILSKPNRVFDVVPEPGRTEEKAKVIRLYGGESDNLYKGEGFDLYVKQQIGGRTYYEDIGTYHIDEVGDTISTATAWLSSGKDVAEALQNDDELILASYGDHYAEKQLNNSDDIPKVNLALKKKCLFCTSPLELVLFKSPVINLVERQTPELVYFGRLLKDERFIDFHVEDYQGKRLGYELLVVPENKYCEVVDVRKNTNLISLPYTFTMTGNQVVPTLGYSAIHRMLGAYNPEQYAVQMLEVLKEKKDKIEEIAIFHPAGMTRYMEFDLSVLVTEEVDGQSLDRRQLIGNGRVGSSISTNISKLKIKDGERELYQAITTGKAILITVSDSSNY